LFATTGSHPSAVCHHSVIGILAGCASKDQTDDNLMVLGQDCRVGLAVVSVQILWCSQGCVYICGLSSWRSNILTYFLWYKPNKK